MQGSIWQPEDCTSPAPPEGRGEGEEWKGEDEERKKERKEGWEGGVEEEEDQTKLPWVQTLGSGDSAVIKGQNEKSSGIHASPHMNGGGGGVGDASSCSFKASQIKKKNKKLLCWKKQPRSTRYLPLEIFPPADIRIQRGIRRSKEEEGE